MQGQFYYGTHTDFGKNRVQYDEILYMGSCMGAMMAGTKFCQGSSGFGMDIKLFDFMEGTSLEYESGTKAAACTTNTISAQTIKITSGSGVAVHVWADKRTVQNFRISKNDNGWVDWSGMVSGIYEAEEVAQKIARRRCGPYWACTSKTDLYYFRLSGAVEYVQREDELRL